MLSALTRRVRFLGLAGLAALACSTCSKKSADPAAALAAMPAVPVAASNSEAAASLLYPESLDARRVNLGGQIRTALPLPPKQTIEWPAPTEAGRPVRFAVGIIPQYWEAHPEPVTVRVYQGRQEIFSLRLDPRNNTSHRTWQECRLEPTPAPAEKWTVAAEARDLGVVITPWRVVGPPAHPSVLFILVDALRPDRLGAYGDTGAETPHLDALAASGVKFETVITASSFTMTSLATIFTGLYPWEHGVIFTQGLRLNPALPTLAEQFHQQGYTTAAFSGTYFRLSPAGLDRGFELFDESCAQSFFRDSADCLSRAALPWIAAHADEPFFLYLHFTDTHAPYYPPDRFRDRFTKGLSFDHDEAGLGDAARFGPTRQWYQWPISPTPRDLAYLQALYHGEAAYADEKIGAVLDALRQTGSLTSTYVLLTADHGEAFGEHGRLEHHEVLYDEVLKVPLLLSGPGIPAGRVVPDQVRTLDYGATLLALAALPGPLGAGRSLLPAMTGAVLEPTPALAAVYLKREETGLAIRTADWKLIATPQGALELYRLADDPREQTDLARTNPDQAARLQSLLRSLGPSAR